MDFFLLKKIKFKILFKENKYWIIRSYIMSLKVASLQGDEPAKGWQALINMAKEFVIACLS